MAAVANELENSSYSGYTSDFHTIEVSLAYHDEILNAIKEHNPEKAQKVMRDHINNIYTVLRTLLY